MNRKTNPPEWIFPSLVVMTIIFLMSISTGLSFFYSAYSEGYGLTSNELFTLITTQGIAYKFNELERPVSDVRLGKNTINISFDYTLDNTVGSSMFPSLKRGDLMLMKNFTKKTTEIKDGFIVDCLEIDADGKVQRVLHRVVGVYSGYYYLQGDRNAYPDEEFCYPQNLKGYMVGVIYGGDVIH